MVKLDKGIELKRDFEVKSNLIIEDKKNETLNEINSLESNLTPQGKNIATDVITK